MVLLNVLKALLAHIFKSDNVCSHVVYSFPWADNTNYPRLFDLEQKTFIFSCGGCVKARSFGGQEFDIWVLAEMCPL